jgi:hypothetical protein
MHTRYTKAMKNPKFAKILEEEALSLHIGELLTEAMHKNKTDKFFLSTETGIDLSAIEDILKGGKADIRDLATLFFTLGLRLEITTAPLES